MDPLLAECCSAPLDDAPRLVWADAIGGPRGELVVLQCDLARGALAPAESAARRRGQRALLAEHGRSWSELEGLATQVRYRRGFVEYAAFPAWSIADQLDVVFAAAPLLAAMRFDGVASPTSLTRLLEHARFAAIRGLALPSLYADNLTAVVDSGVIAQLDTLELALDSRMPTTRAARLLDATLFERIERFRLRDPGEVVGPLAELVAMMPQLRALDVDGEQDLGAALAAVSPQLVELTIHASALPVLIASPVAERLERLILHDVDVVAQHALSSGHGFPRLRSLALDMHTRRNRQTNQYETLALGSGFAAARWPALRELRCDSVAVEAIRAIGEALGSQLELMQLPGMIADELTDVAPLFAGDLHATPLVGAHPLLLGGDYPNAPLWDYPRVNLGPSAKPDR